MGLGDATARAFAKLPIHGGLRRSLDRVYRPDDPAFRVDYLAGPGDPGDCGPDSVTWRVMANPIVFALGAIPAVILQMAEEGIGKGVDTYSTYKADTLGRTQRTLSAALASTYASTSAKAALMQEVARRHAKVRGPLDDGSRYSAFDPARMTFVHLTAGFGFAEAYHRLIRPLSAEERDRLVAESAAVAGDYGRFAVPRSHREAEDFIRQWAPRLSRRPELDNFLAIARRGSIPGMAGGSSKGLLVTAGIALLPRWARDQLGFPRRPVQEALAFAALRPLARFVPHIMTDTPPQLACRRLGLPEDFLFRQAEAPGAPTLTGSLSRR
ncbi:oxygenase MpaB family protein [Zavarzinia compransoris]|uniref:ER-bound oxygenase mpaB/mpaB'/Rubber oxygenase catalytic domain-containing protein n=1 Tax=Zavarzinia compransoris TaxID=1264899 RepID=A0A317E167_9PROT|nr:oxygenase MpaB family protein [Zavarzinia compransoris]PWR18895.1 hypothetical protein DKG75_18145 [Zavarzinia compransoris]TDP48890.1 uncharacterized protein (DUF2236 family) [Zavarzinia compransoris]